MTGRVLSFPHQMQVMGITGLHESFFLAVNFGMVWCAGPLLALVARKYRGVSPAIGTFLMLNGLSHASQVIRLHTYNAGALTGICLMIPIGLWVIFACFVKNGFRWRTFWALVGTGVLYCAILLMTNTLSTNGVLAGVGQTVVMNADALLYAGLSVWIGKNETDALARKELLNEN